MTRSASFVVSVVMVVLVAACSSKGGGPSPVAQKDGAAGLQALFEASQAACAAKDAQQGRSLTLSVIPGKEQLMEVLEAEVSTEVVDKILGQYKELPAEDEQVACLFSPPGRTEIRVHASTVEDLIAYQQGSVAFAEFPGGANKLATQLLRPGTTFYEVEVTEPGKASGTKFHMFFWDGGQWRMLGPAWRALRD